MKQCFFMKNVAELVPEEKHIRNKLLTRHCEQ